MAAGTPHIPAALEDPYFPQVPGVEVLALVEECGALGKAGDVCFVPTYADVC